MEAVGCRIAGGQEAKTEILVQIYKTSEAFRCWSTVTQTTKTDFIKLAGAGQLGGTWTPRGDGGAERLTDSGQSLAPARAAVSTHAAVVDVATPVLSEEHGRISHAA